MKKIIKLLLLSICFVILSGCMTTYRGVLSVRSDAGDTPDIWKKQAVSVRKAAVKVLSEMGFEIEESRATSAFDIMPGFHAGIPAGGLYEPYNNECHVWLSVSFTYPFFIVISDIGNGSESEFVKEIRQRLEAELVSVEPGVKVRYRIDYFRLD